MLRKLTELGIEYERFEHEPAMTMEDKDHIVHAALDSDLLKEEKLLIHPNINTASLAVGTQDILKFIISLGYDYKLIEAEKESE